MLLGRAVLTATLLTAVLTLLPYEKVFAAIRRVPPSLWLLLVFGFLAGHLVSAGKWRLLLRAAGVEVSVRETLRAYAAGLFANLCLPSLIGGDVVRAGLVARGGRLEAVALGSLVDRLIDTAALLLLVAGAALLVPIPLDDRTGRWLAAAAAIWWLAGAGLALALLVIPPGWVPGPLREFFERLRTAFRSLVRQPSRAAAALLIAICVQGGFVWLNAGIGAAVGLALPLAAWFLVWPLAKLTALIPVSLGGIGVREAATAALVVPFAADPSLGVAQSLVWESVLIAGGLVAGSLWWLSRRRRSGS